MSEPLLTCQQIAERIRQQHEGIHVTRYMVWHAATRSLGLTPAFQQTPTEAQKKVGGATMFFSEEQARRIAQTILSRTPSAAAA